MARTSYCSLNLITVDAAPGGFDLREIHERGWGSISRRN